MAAHPPPPGLGMVLMLLHEAAVAAHLPVHPLGMVPEAASQHVGTAGFGAGRPSALQAAHSLLFQYLAGCPVGPELVI